MKNRGTLPGNLLPNNKERLFRFQLFMAFLFLMPFCKTYATDYTSVATGNWSSTSTWSPSGVPGSGDNVTIHGGNTVTADGTDACNNLTIGDATSSNTTLQITTSGNSITINGALSINPSNTSKTYILNAGPGSINISGTFAWGTAGTSEVEASTGTVTFTPAVTIAYSAQNIILTGAGTINFNSSFTDNYNNLVPYAGAIINFAASYTVSTTAASWAGKGTAVFSGTGTITANSSLTFNNIQLAASAATTLASAAGTVIISDTATLGSASTFTANENFELEGNWYNNGGAMAGSNDTIILLTTLNTIGGSSPTTFPVIQLGNASSTAVSYTMNNNNSCSGLIYYGNGVANTLTLSSGDSLTINGDVTINQPTSAATNNLLINTGVGIITGNLNLPGTVATANHVAKVTVTTGSFVVNGNVNWGNNTVAATEVVTVSTGTLSFNSSMTMASGTLSVTSTGTINFNGSSSPSFNFGGSNAPVFTTTSGCTLKFKNGFTNNTTALTLIAGSNTYFTGSGSVTPNATITFGNVQLDSLAYDTLNAAAGTGIVAGSFTLLHGSNIEANQALEVRGVWTNNGGTISTNANPIIMNGAGQTIGGSASTTFPILQMGGTSVATAVTCTANVNFTCDSLVFNGYTKARTLTLSSGVTLTVNGNVNINQPTSGGTNSLTVGAGTCNVSGNLNFIGTSNTTSYIAKVAVTTGAFSLTGSVNWMSNTAIATEVISVSTGTLTFASSLTMGTGTGTLTVSGAATVNFNGTAEPSFNFGGAATSPVFTTTAGCTLNFKTGFTNNFKLLTLAATSTSNFTGHGLITPSSAITFGSVFIKASDTLASGGAVIAAGNFTLNSGSLFYAEENLEVDGNWVNSGGSLSGTTYTVFLNGTAQTISGSSTTFQTLEIGNSTTAVNVAVTMNCNTTCSALIFEAGAHNRALTLSSATALTVSGNLTLNQPTANSMTALLEIGSSTCNVSGNMVFSGTNATTTRISKVDVTSGSFTLAGSITWGGSTAAGDDLISVNTGTLTFSSSVSMGTKSGTMQVTGSGIISFNGTSAPSFAFGGTKAPVFNSVSGSIINIKNGITTSTTPLTFASGSNVVFTGSGTATPAAALTFGNIQISSGSTLTTAGNIYVNGNWTDSGSFVPATYLVTLNGSGTQTIFRNSSAETFYQLAANTSGAIVKLLNNVTVTNALTMGGDNININNYTLTLGNNAGATLNYIGGIAYGGTWQRWFPATAISDSSGAYYGLFPIGTSTDYRYVAINSTVNPTTAGYISATHTDATGGTVVHYTDNEGSLIQEIANLHSDISTSGLAGGTYNIQVHFTGISTSGNVADLKLETYTGNVMGSCGAFAVPVGPVNTPTVGRTGITATNLANRWVIGTDDESATPLYAFYISRKTGNWNDTTAGNGTWALSSDSLASSCDCIPISGSYVVIDSGNTVTATTSDSVDFIDIYDGATFINNSSRTLTVIGNMTLFGDGTVTNNGTLSIGGDLELLGDNTLASNGNVSVGYDLHVPSGATYTQSGGTLSANGNVIDSGTITATTGGIINLTGNAAIISGNGTISDSIGNISISHNKTISGSAALTIGTSTANTNLVLASTVTVNNEGSITLNGNIRGTTSSSGWTNNANSVLNITGALLDTGNLDASIGPNTVNYNGSGSQTITAPATSYYNLSALNAGTKSVVGALQVTNALNLDGSSVLNESTNVVSGNAALNMNGTSQLQLQRSTAGTYPELTGIYSLTAGTVVIDQTGDSATVNGAQYYNLTLDGTTAYDISAISIIGNNLNMQSSSILNNNSALTVGGTFTYASSGYTTLSDNITVSEMTINSGTLDDGGLNITINGVGWNMNGGTFNSEGQTIFAGKTPLYIGGSQSSTFNNLELDGTSIVTLSVSPAAPTIVTGNLNLLSGNLVTDSINILRMLDTSTVSNASASSFVSGPMVKVGAGSFVFPTGKDGYLGQAGVSGIADSTTEVTAEYFDIGYPIDTPLSDSLTVISKYEYWNITRAVTTDPVQIQLFWTDALWSHILNCSLLTIAEWTGSEWINVTSSTIGGSVCSGDGGGSVQSTGAVSSFGPFTFGSDDGGEALPLQLLSFNATPAKSTVLTTWQTDLEINNAYFTVERSADAETFLPIGQVTGAGNSATPLSYNFTDEAPLTGISYYRLKQTDYNGNSTFSNIVAVNFAAPGNFSVYPNPTAGQVFINVPNPSGEINLNIYDITGSLIFKKNVAADEGSSNQIIPLSIAGTLPAGIYIVSVTSNLNEYNQKLVVK